MKSDPVASAQRLNLLPDRSFLDLKPALVERLERIGAGLRAEQFASALDPLMRQVLDRGFAEAGAHEGTVWLLDANEHHLVPAYNNGPNAHRMVGRFKQPLSAGLICMVFASEQPFLENEVQANALQSKLLDSALAVRTTAMLAVPFSFLRAPRGVISCVQLENTRAGKGSSGAPPPPPAAPGFRPEHLAGLQLAATLVAQLLEFRLLSRAVGWSCE